MASLTNTKIKDTYDGLLKTTDNDALGGTYKLITDGLGNSSGVYLGTGGNVGIGAATPDDGDLQIGDSNTSFNIAIAGTRTKFGYDGTNAVVQGGGAKGIKFCVDNNTFGSGEAMRINSDGYVGIGEIDPSKPLTIKKDQSETAILVQSSDTGLSGIYLGGITDSIKGGLICDNSDNSIQLRGYDNATRLFVKSDGKIGIGTNDPAELLTVSASDDVSIRINSTKNGTWTTNQKLGALEFFGNDSSSSGAGLKGYINLTSVNTFGAAFNMNFGVGDNATDRMVITHDGDVGLGENNPDRQLHLKSSLPAIRLEDSDVTGLYHEFFASTAGFFQFKADGGNVQANSGYLFQVDGSEKMRINSSGNIGINYTNPQQKLEVSGASRFSRTGSESAQYMEFLPLSGGNILKAVGQSKSLIFDNTSSTSNEIHFRQSGSNKMIIKNGVVLVGKSSSAANTVGCELNPIGLAQLTRDGNLPLLVNRKTSDGTIVSIRRDNVQKGSISVSGSTTSFNTSSDYRLKENVVDMTGALDRVEQLQPKRFNFISDAETTVDGFIAHEVQSIIPEAITGEKDAVDDEGNPEYQGIDQSKIVPLLVGAIKELKAEIETLKSQIN